MIDRDRAWGWNQGLVGATVLSLLLLPLLAAYVWAWPGFVGLSMAATLALLLLWKRDSLNSEQVLWGALLLRLAFLPLLPGLTDDLYRYIWDGWIQLEGVNPYRYVPEDQALSEFQSALIYDRLNSQGYYSVYPPLAQIVFAIGGSLYAIDWTASYYVLKVLLTGAEFAGLVLLSRLTSARNLLLYAWNPLVLVETAGQGHLEALLVPTLVGLVWAVQKDRVSLASVAVVAAGMVKLYPFVLWPFLVRRYGLSAVWPGAAFGIALSIPYAASYTLPHLKESVDLFVHLMEFNAGGYYLVKYLAWACTGSDWSKVIGPIFRYSFVSLLPLLYYLDWCKDWSLRRAVMVTVGLFLVLSTTVHPWYLVPILALGVMAPRPAWPWLWLGCFSIGTYLFYTGGSYWVWIVLGWGGGAVLALWQYGPSPRDLGAVLGSLPARSKASVQGREACADS